MYKLYVRKVCIQSANDLPREIKLPKKMLALHNCVLVQGCVCVFVRETETGTRIERLYVYN